MSNRRFLVLLPKGLTWCRYHLFDRKTVMALSEPAPVRWFLQGLLGVGLLFLGLVLLDQLYPLKLQHNEQLFSRVVLDENDQPLRTFADDKGIWRYPVKLSEVSPLYIEALVNYEDRWFWTHPGINPFSLLRAAFQNLTSGRIVSGGSTLSMQVARILHPHQRTVLGKIQQIFRTLQLEWHLDKSEILQIYLNRAPFGGTIEGVQAASYTYLNKSARELTHSEAALLAVLPQAPTRYRPDLHHQAAQNARNKVLLRLAAHHIWSRETVNDAMVEQVFSFNFRPAQLAPLLSRRLLSRSRNQAVIKSTINKSLQQRSQEVLQSYIHPLPKRSSAAVLIVDNHTSAVKTYIGTGDFGNAERFGYVDMVQGIRSPGSTLKPFLYGLAIDEGLIHSHSLLADVPRHWGAYRPANFSGQFQGPVSATDALQRSLNMPAVDLLERYGSNRFVAQLENAGQTLVIPHNKPNLAVILGGLGTSLEQLVQSYSAFANQGKVTQLRYLAQDLLAPKITRNLLPPSSAWTMQKILSDIKRPDEIHTLTARPDKKQLAWKTGTSYGFRDSWAIGVNRDYTIGVWVGRPDGTAMPGHYGRLTAGPLLFKIYDQLPTETAPIPQPKNVIQSTICWPLGTLESTQEPHHCQQKHQAWIANGVVPPTWHHGDSDVWHTPVFKYWVNDKNQLRVSMDCSVKNKQAKEVVLWPKVLEPWINRKNRRSTLIPLLDPQCKNTSVAPSASLRITGITPDSIYRQAGQTGPPPSVWLKTLGGDGNKNWYINGQHQYETLPEQGIEHVLSQKGKQQIVVQDQSGNSDMLSVYVQ